MPSDRARGTYDEQQQFASVVMQQGRVLLEADWNEQQEIAAEHLRTDVREIIGPTGTPDDGYRVVALDAATRHVAVVTGTMYVGGMRASLPFRRIETPSDLWSYAIQPDWRDPDPFNPLAPHEIIWLELFEQEISAVEDPALLDPAIAGPDTAQRTRIRQRIHRTAVGAGDCAAAFADLQGQWFQQGFHFDFQTMMLIGNATLLVSFYQDPSTADPCDPVTQAGYLGLENQMIRVAVSAQNRIVWSYDDASFIYRVTAYDSARKTLTLAARPVDDHHRPRKGQVVELLHDTMTLPDGGIVAMPFGPIVAIVDDYNPDDKTITISAALPPGFEPKDGSVVLYVRVWEEELPFTPDTPVKLEPTGLQVTLEASSSAFPVGDFWTFAMRPGTPSEVYPSRYRGNSPQPPEGFRRWVCPLAVIDWSTASTTRGSLIGSPTVTDCREVFDNLVELTKRRKTCCYTIRPEDLQRTTLQQIIDGQPSGSTFCLAPGRYPLPRPLVITSNHGAITIEGCGHGVILEAENPEDAAFAPGLVHLLDTRVATLRNLEFESPATPAQRRPFVDLPNTGVPNNPALNQQIALEKTEVSDKAPIAAVIFPRGSVSIDVGIILRIFGATDLTVEECTFTLSAPSQALCGAAVLAHGPLEGMAFRNNHVVGAADRPLDVAGVVIVPSLFRANSGVQALRTSVNRLTIEENRFSDLTHAVLICGELHEIAIRENSIAGCTHGIALISSRWFGLLASIDADAVKSVLPELDRKGQDLRRLVPNNPEMVISALCVSTHALFHPTIDVPLAAYATIVPPGAPAGDLITLSTLPPASNLVVDSIAAVAASAELYFLPFSVDVNKNEIPVETELSAVWGKRHPLTNVLPGALRDLDLTMFATAAFSGITADISHNTVTWRDGGFHPAGIALLTIADEGLVTPGATFDGTQITGFPTGSDTIVSSSDLRTTHRFFPAALMLFERRCALTGNLIRNNFTPQPEQLAPSLVLLPVVDRFVFPQSAAVQQPDGMVPTAIAKIPLFATTVTGNTFIGWPILPPHTNRHMTVPPWIQLNTAIDYTTAD